MGSEEEEKVEEKNEMELVGGVKMRRWRTRRRT